MSLVSIKRRTIIAWIKPTGERTQTVPLPALELNWFMQVGKDHGWKLLYLVRCKPRRRKFAGGNP